MINVRTAVGSCLIVAGLSLGTALAQGPPPEKKGTPVEVLTQDNTLIKFELQEMGAAYNDSTRMSFTKKLEPKMSQIAWFEIPIVPNPKKGLQIREIRMADEGQKYKDSTDGQEYLFYSVVLVPYDGFTASWQWQAESLSGVTRDQGAPRPISIPLSNVKVVRFPKAPGA
jgi:hypothetical protein